MLNGERVFLSELDTTTAGIMEKAGVTGLSLAIISEGRISTKGRALQTMKIRSFMPRHSARLFLRT